MKLLFPALRVHRAVTRLMVYRPLQVLGVGLLAACFDPLECMIGGLFFQILTKFLALDLVQTNFSDMS